MIVAKILNAAPLRRLQHEKHPFLLVRCRWHRAVPARVVPTNSMTMVIKPNVYNAMESPFKVGTLKHACYTVLSDAGERGARVQEIVTRIQDHKLAHLAGSTPANTICSALSSGALSLLRK
eukprot:2844281-Pyramimonas_sp.AAC.1